MKALSLTQPWAMLICLQATPHIPEKEFETRGWRWTPRPQEIYVHAAKNFPKWARDLCHEEPFRSALARHGWDVPPEQPEHLPLQSIIGKVRIVRTLKTEAVRDIITPTERAFGDYSDGRIAIQLADPVFFRAHIRCNGALGLWDVPQDIAARLREAA